LIERNWWRGTFDSAEDLTAHFPQVSHWENCTQHDQQPEVDTYAILNALALASGLEINHTFYSDDLRDFFHKAQLVFEAALNDQLDWRLLRGFLVGHGYTIQPGAEEDPESVLPPLNRCFDLRMRPFHFLVRGEREQDEVLTARRTAEDIRLAGKEIYLAIGRGVLHTEDLPSDTWPADFRCDTVRRIAMQGTWSIHDSEEAVLENLWISFPEEGLDNDVVPADTAGADRDAPVVDNNEGAASAPASPDARSKQPTPPLPSKQTRNAAQVDAFTQTGGDLRLNSSEGQNNAQPLGSSATATQPQGPPIEYTGDCGSCEGVELFAYFIGKD
jgi:hypothetical protein